MKTGNQFVFSTLCNDTTRGGMIVHEMIVNGNFDTISLTTGGQRIKYLPNAGGNSISSEVMSYEVLHLLFKARLSRTEMELEYCPHGSKITDYSVTLPSGEPIGVSVTRAMKFRGVFDQTDANALLTKKLYGVNASTKAVVQETWKRQVLHVMAENDNVANQLEIAFEKLDPTIKSNTIVIITLVKNARWIFTNCW